MNKRRNYNPPIQKVCVTCGNKFMIAPSALRHGRTGQYCSAKCYKKFGANNPKWRGGRLNIGGYIYLYRPEHPNSTNAGYVAEHRLIMEYKLGRTLDKNEVVHHLNMVETDNRIENLALVSPSEHNTIHHKGVKHSPEHIRKRFANRNKADMSKAKRDASGRFTR